MFCTESKDSTDVTPTPTAPADQPAGRRELTEQRFTGERALFGSTGLTISDSTFADGESPLKESHDLDLTRVSFQWKYPLWYTHGVTMTDSSLLETARSGIWYAEDVRISRTVIDAPKTFRHARRVSLSDVDLPHAEETLWWCSDVTLTNVTATGDYFGMNSSRVRADGLRISGNYAFDGAEDVLITGSRLHSKDAFWNCRNVTVRDSVIVGEYLGWNSTNVTFENCTIRSLQGLCYINGLTLRNCAVLDTTGAFEFSTVDAEVTTRIDSVVNPRGGRIQAPGIGELTLDPDQIDPSATVIEVPGDL